MDDDCCILPVVIDNLSVFNCWYSYTHCIFPSVQPSILMINFPVDCSIFWVNLGRTSQCGGLRKWPAEESGTQNHLMLVLLGTSQQTMDLPWFALPVATRSCFHAYFPANSGTTHGTIDGFSLCFGKARKDAVDQRRWARGSVRQPSDPRKWKQMNDTDTLW